jgi:hypothetical protein
MQRITSFSTLNDALPKLKNGWKEYCIDDHQCKVTTCPIFNLIANLGQHVKAENKFMIFGDMLIMEQL